MVRIPKTLRDSIIQRANYCCEYCKSPQKFMGMKLELDHILPESKGGKTILDNLCAACRNCNASKFDATTAIDPDTNNAVDLFNPRTQRWANHFSWSDDISQITGLTAIGRAAISRLKMNRAIIIIARKEWRKAGWMPKE